MPTAKNENMLKPNKINTVVFESSNSPKLIERKQRSNISFRHDNTAKLTIKDQRKTGR